MAIAAEETISITMPPQGIDASGTSDLKHSAFQRKSSVPLESQKNLMKKQFPREVISAPNEKKTVINNQDISSQSTEEKPQVEKINTVQEVKKRDSLRMLQKMSI